MHAIKTPEVTTRAISVARVCELTGASRATVWRWAKDDHTFPKPFRLSAGITRWDEGEVLHWINAKKARRGPR
jgi:predicted DNA-binding transcriptional regulator AlpA